MGNRKQPAPPDDPAPAGRERISAGTAEDVAALFTWANLQGARYWDFAQSRRRYRQQVRARAAVAIAERSESQPAAAQSGSRTNISASPLQTGSAPSPPGHPTEEAPPGEHFLRSQRYAVAESFVEFSRESGTYQPALLWEPAPLRAPKELPPEDPGEVWMRSLLEERRPRGRAALPGLPARAAQSPSEDKPSSGSGPPAVSRPGQSVFASGPEWIYGDLPSHSAAMGAASGPEPLHWASLQSTAVFGPARALSGPRGLHEGPPGALVLIFSFGGGVGRTSLLATLGRALSRAGERVALGDTEPYSPLPFYFGAREVRHGLARAFASPIRPADPPVFVASYDLARGGDPAEQRRIMREILRNGSQANRILLDLPASADWLFRRLATLQPTVLVPLVPDADTLLTVDAIEHYFEPVTGSEGEPLQPFYLFSQFEPSLRLHADMREILKRRLGLRLIGQCIRRSPLVSEALAEGLSVIDFAPESAVAQDYLDLAGWLQTVAPALAPAYAGGSTR